MKTKQQLDFFPPLLMTVQNTKGDTNVVLNYLAGRHREERSHGSQKRSVTGWEAVETHMARREVLISCTEKVFSTIKCGNRFPWEAVKSPALERCKSQVEIALGIKWAALSRTRCPPQVPPNLNCTVIQQRHWKDNPRVHQQCEVTYSYSCVPDFQ